MDIGDVFDFSRPRVDSDSLGCWVSSRPLSFNLQLPRESVEEHGRTPADSEQKCFTKDYFEHFGVNGKHVPRTQTILLFSWDYEPTKRNVLLSDHQCVISKAVSTQSLHINAQSGVIGNIPADGLNMFGKPWKTMEHHGKPMREPTEKTMAHVNIHSPSRFAWFSRRWALTCWPWSRGSGRGQFWGVFWLEEVLGGSTFQGFRCRSCGKDFD